jgi:hypothetical protein
MTGRPELKQPVILHDCDELTGQFAKIRIGHTRRHVSSK